MGQGAMNHQFTLKATQLIKLKIHFSVPFLLGCNPSYLVLLGPGVKMTIKLRAVAGVKLCIHRCRLKRWLHSELLLKVGYDTPPPQAFNCGGQFICASVHYHCVDRGMVVKETRYVDS